MVWLNCFIHFSTEADNKTCFCLTELITSGRYLQKLQSVNYWYWQELSTQIIISQPSDTTRRYHSDVNEFVIAKITNRGIKTLCAWADQMRIHNVADFVKMRSITFCFIVLCADALGNFANFIFSFTLLVQSMSILENYSQPTHYSTPTMGQVPRKTLTEELLVANERLSSNTHTTSVCVESAIIFAVVRY